MNLESAISRFHEIDNKTGIVSSDIKVEPNVNEREELWEITRVFLDRIYELDIEPSKDITEYNQLCHWSIVALHWNDLLTEGLFSDNGRFRRDTVALALCLYTRIDRSYDHHLFIRRTFIVPHTTWSFFLWTTYSIMQNNMDNIFNQFSPDEAEEAKLKWKELNAKHGCYKWNNKDAPEDHPVNTIIFEIYRAVGSNRLPFKFALKYIWMGPGMSGGMGLLSKDRDMNKAYLQNQMEHKQFPADWNINHDYAYIYLYFASQTDQDLSEEEIIKEKIKEWMADATPEKVDDVYSKALELLKDDKTKERFVFTLENVRTYYNSRWMHKETERPKIKKNLSFILQDLVTIASDDGRIIKEEFELVEEIRMIWGIDIKLFDKDVETELNSTSDSVDVSESIFDKIIINSETEENGNESSEYLENYPGELYCKNSRWDSQKWKNYPMTVKPFLNVFEDGEYEFADLFRRFTFNEVNQITKKIKSSGTLIYLPFVRDILSKKFDMRGLKNPFWFDPFIISGALDGAAGLFYFEQNGFIQNTHDSAGDWTDPATMNLVSHVDLISGISIEKGYNSYWEGHLDGIDEDKVTTMDIEWYNPSSGNSGLTSFIQTQGEKYSSTLPIVKAIWDNTWKNVVDRSKDAGCFVLGPPPMWEHFESWDALLTWANTDTPAEESATDTNEIESVPDVSIESPSDEGPDFTKPDELILYLDKYILDKYDGVTSKKAKSGLTSYNLGKKKILQISSASKGRVELLILRDYNKDYLRPSIEGLNISNIRKYDPEIKSYRRPWGYMFYKLLMTPQEFTKFQEVIASLIDSSYNTAADDKILKVSASEHEKLGPIFHGTSSV